MPLYWPVLLFPHLITSETNVRNLVEKEEKNIQGADENSKNVYRELYRKTQECFASDDPDYTSMMMLRGDGNSEGDVAFFYSIIEDSKDMTRDMISAQIVYRGLGWVGLAMSEAGQMIGSEAIIGLPDNKSVEKYALSSKSTAGITPLPSQTLIDASIVQTDTTTTLTFTKFLSEPNELEIALNGPQFFLWAVGSGNALAYHHSREAFQLDLSQGCAGTIVGGVASTRSLWIAHGILAAVGWAIATPFAIMIPWFRDISGVKGKWFKYHMHLNLLTTVLTVILFIISVTAVSKKGGRHFHSAHNMVGLVIFIGVIFHVVLSFLRPHIEEGERKTAIRHWGICHKTIGYSLLAASIWQFQSGLKLLSTKFGIKSYTWYYWSWLIALGVTATANGIWAYLKKKRTTAEPSELQHLLSQSNTQQRLGLGM